VRDAHIGSQITANDDIVACCEGALGSVIPHGQHRRGGCLGHRNQLYRQGRQLTKQDVE
jgi:hypothetical protein